MLFLQNKADLTVFVNYNHHDIILIDSWEKRNQFFCKLNRHRVSVKCDCESHQTVSFEKDREDHRCALNIQTDHVWSVCNMTSCDKRFEVKFVTVIEWSLHAIDYFILKISLQTAFLHNFVMLLVKISDDLWHSSSSESEYSSEWIVNSTVLLQTKHYLNWIILCKQQKFFHCMLIYFLLNCILMSQWRCEIQLCNEVSEMFYLHDKLINVQLCQQQKTSLSLSC